MEKEIALKDLVSDDKKYNAIMHTVRTGMNVCVLGESMTGKSTLLDAIFRESNAKCPIFLDEIRIAEIDTIAALNNRVCYGKARNQLFYTSHYTLEDYLSLPPKMLANTFVIKMGDDRNISGMLIIPEDTNRLMTVETVS